MSRTLGAVLFDAVLESCFPSSVSFFNGYGHHRDLHSFPTRRSSDLQRAPLPCQRRPPDGQSRTPAPVLLLTSTGRQEQDRKSTRLNSSHTVISYAVFCLKKKKKIC